MRRGAFLTIEGLEGAGKSSSIATISKVLKNKMIPYISTREPGGTELGEHVRDILLATSQEPMQPMTELLLMFASRAEHISRVINPHINSGDWVVCDRFIDSSFAYQGGGRGLNLSTIQDLERLSLPKTRPDHIFILDIPVEEGLKRAESRGERDRFEQEDIIFFERARKVFLDRSHGNPIYTVIDASNSEQQVQADIREHLETFIEHFKKTI
ncbi:MAG: dTMP kinase [Candidatus Azotimanducaceae bacterium]|uniref:Thymidylate kinase n=1 Tax=OM182 bacterium TaxID=2510334 RepID=A0A520RYE2_9GAMM|nr:dTMP kinase [Gammaproteobacteria bacterium]RZO75218.1 MAG: dTMP kinase [OM182 bacterium]